MNYLQGTHDQRPRLCVTAPGSVDTVRAIIADAVDSDKPPLFYCRGAIVCDLYYYCRGIDVRPLYAADVDIDSVDVFRLQQLIDRYVSWYRIDDAGDEDEVTTTPQHVARAIIATLPPLPVLNTITDVPAYNRSWQLETVPGYQRGTKNYFRASLKLTVPTNPAPDDVTRARNLIDEYLANFEFMSDSDRANTAGLLLMPIIAPAINGPTPLAIVTCGNDIRWSSMLVGALTTIWTGEPDDDDDDNYVLVAVRSDADCDALQRVIDTAHGAFFKRVFLLENVASLQSDALARALAENYVTDDYATVRPGTHAPVPVPMHGVWLATATAVRVAPNIADKCIGVRVKKWELPQLPPNASLRDARRHEQRRDRIERNKRHRLREIVAQRGEIIAAAITLIQSWIAAGRPQISEKSMLRLFNNLSPIYTNWATATAAILAHNGIHGFLGNTEAFHNEITTDKRVSV